MQLHFGQKRAFGAFGELITAGRCDAILAEVFNEFLLDEFVRVVAQLCLGFVKKTFVGKNAFHLSEADVIVFAVDQQVAEEQKKQLAVPADE